MKEKARELSDRPRRADRRRASHRRQILGSLQDRYIRCLECGRRMQALGVHVLRAHSMGGDEYREKHGLNRGQGLISGKLQEKKSRWMVSEWEQGRRLLALRPGASRPHPWVRRFQSVVTTSGKYNRVGYDLAVEVARQTGSVNSYQWRKAVLDELLSPFRGRIGSVSWKDVSKADPVLYRYASRLWQRHGGLANALSREGVTVRSIQRWDQAKVMAGIRERAARGLPLNSHAMRRQDVKLQLAARRLFGGPNSWNKALEAAGIEPASVRLGHRKKWTKSKITAAIQDIFSRKGVIGQDRMGNYGLVQAGRAEFGSWKKAVSASGFTPIRGGWDRTRVIARIQDRRARGLPLNGAAVEKDEPGLFRAAYRYFGKPAPWGLALAAAGLDPNRIRKHKATGETVAKAMRAQHQAGQS